MKEVTEVTDIESEVWICIDLLTTLNKIGRGGSRCVKKATVKKKGTEPIVEKSLPVCTFQYSERPTMSIGGEQMSEGRE